MTERFNVDVGDWGPGDQDVRHAPDPRDELPDRAELQQDQIEWDAWYARWIREHRSRPAHPDGP